MMTKWILVDGDLKPDQRPILCSCESFYKRSLKSDEYGTVKDVVIHGIASVFCPQPLRGRGYAARLMRELGRTLQAWQADGVEVVGSVLYSDIGKDYYTRLGWIPNQSNMHYNIPPVVKPQSPLVRLIEEAELAYLCQVDMKNIRMALATPAPGVLARVTILPDLNHMLWHLRKEDFATKHLYNKTPSAKGAIAGPPGKQVWAIWTRRYYQRPDAASEKNVLYILRLVVEGDDSANRALETAPEGSLPKEQATYLEAVLQAARNEAAEWELDHVKLWEPPLWVRKAIANGSIDYKVVERVKDSIASAMWYDEGSAPSAVPTWINNEHFAWC
jgi:hypothetical protein